MSTKRKSQPPSRRQTDSVDAEQLDAREKAVEQKERENAIALREAKADLAEKLAKPGPGGLPLTPEQAYDAAFDVPRRRRRRSEDDA